ncbi:MAG: hypothetical protein J1E80_08800 [Desulfovibrionaceae bacterium]|nr:hypothetical protein [Desulfovibrionaceae bacterium]
MRSLFLAAAALCAVLCPLSSPCAQQTAPAASTPASPVADGAAYRLSILDDNGTRRALVFQPITEAQAEPAATVATRAPASPAQSAEPAASPAQADTPGQSSPAPGRPTDINTLPRAPLYAPTTAVESAWNRFAPRQMAYAPRAWMAPDPAVHSALPVRRTPAKRAAGSSQTAQNQARAAAKTPPATPVQQGFDALVSVVQTLCPPQAGPAASVAEEGAAAASPAPAPARSAATAPNPAIPR